MAVSYLRPIDLNNRFGREWRSVAAYYNEIDPYAAAWLRELIKAGHIADGEVDERSIVAVQTGDLRGFVQCHFFAGIGGWSYALRLAGWSDAEPVWTGSCPCQPWSMAGSGAGANDPRHLWPTWFQLIDQCRPATIFGEQTASEDGRYWLDLVYADMEARDYAIAAANLPAASAGAPHARARLWFVADTHGKRCEGVGLHIRERGPLTTCAQAARCGETGALDNAERLRAGRAPGGQGRQERASQSSREDEGRGLLQVVHASATRGFWAECDWLWHRDGVYRAVEPGAFPLAARLPGDLEQIRAYGNAIVPQVAQAFIEAYLEAVGGTEGMKDAGRGEGRTVAR